MAVRVYNDDCDAIYSLHCNFTIKGLLLLLLPTKRYGAL